MTSIQPVPAVSTSSTSLTNEAAQRAQQATSTFKTALSYVALASLSWAALHYPDKLNFIAIMGSSLLGQKAAAAAAESVLNKKNNSHAPFATQIVGSTAGAAAAATACLGLQALGRTVAYESAYVPILMNLAPAVGASALKSTGSDASTPFRTAVTSMLALGATRVFSTLASNAVEAGDVCYDPYLTGYDHVAGMVRFGTYIGGISAAVFAATLGGLVAYDYFFGDAESKEGADAQTVVVPPAAD